MRLNLAGRFWSLYFASVLCGAVLFWSSQAHAGYQATATSSTCSTCGTFPKTSVCALTLGMAIQLIQYNLAMTVTALDANALTWSSTASNGSTAVSWTGNYTTCNTSASGGAEPIFANGTSDPGLVNGQVVGGTTTSSGLDTVAWIAVLAFAALSGLMYGMKS